MITNLKDFKKINEAKVDLESSDPNEKAFAEYCKKNDIKIKVLSVPGKPGPSYFVRYTGSKKALSKMVKKYFPDENEALEELNENGPKGLPEIIEGKFSNGIPYINKRGQLFIDASYFKSYFLDIDGEGAYLDKKAIRNWLEQKIDEADPEIK